MYYGLSELFQGVQYAMVKILWTCRIVCQTGVQRLNKLPTDLFLKQFGSDPLLNHTAGCTSVMPSKHSLMCNIMEGGLIILATQPTILRFYNITMNCFN